MMEKRDTEPQAADETEERWGEAEVTEMLPTEQRGRRAKPGRVGVGGGCPVQG